MSEQYRKAIYDAWEKIRCYCKEQYTGKAHKDIQFRWKHEVYGWQEFGVTPQGDAYFVRGNHAISPTSQDANWYFHPHHQEGYPFAMDAALETIVQDWPAIKERLAKEFDKIQTVYNFTV